jgi:hypothetical protein
VTERQMRSVNDQLDAEVDPRLRTMHRTHSTTVTVGFGPNVRGERERG